MILNYKAMSQAIGWCHLGSAMDWPGSGCGGRVGGRAGFGGLLSHQTARPGGCLPDGSAPRGFGSLLVLVDMSPVYLGRWVH